MSSVQHISSQSSIFTNHRIGQSSQETCPPKPPGEDRQGKEGGGLLGVLDTALKSAGITEGLASIFGKADTESTTSLREDSTADASETASPSEALNAFIQQLMSQLQSSSSADVSDSQESDTSLQTTLGVDQRPPPPPSRMRYGEGLSDKLSILIASLTSHQSDDQTSNSQTDSSTLQSRFNDLVSALGGSTDDSAAQLKNFLSSLASQLEQHHPNGYMVSTSA